MTTDPIPETAPHRDDDPRVRADDVAHPLSAYVHGVLTVHFDGGSVVTREMSQFDARAFLAKQKDTESSDAIRWDTKGWFHWDGSRVVFSSFEADRDQTWPVNPQDRRRLADAGHGHGIVASLVTYWEEPDRRDEPTYSIRAMALLHQSALSVTERATWEALVRAFEGDRGASRLARAHREARGKDSIQVDISEDEHMVSEDLVNDDEQPEDAPGDSKGSGSVSEADSAPGLDADDRESE